jgi:hypothetical protein
MIWKIFLKGNPAYLNIYNFLINYFFKEWPNMAELFYITYIYFGITFFDKLIFMYNLIIIFSL